MHVAAQSLFLYFVDYLPILIRINVLVHGLNSLISSF